MDYIDREKALDVVTDYCIDNSIASVGFASAILAIPKAKVKEEKHGKWYRHNKKEHGDTCYYCSVCQRMALSDCLEWELTKYCPHCGADMRGEKNSNNE